MGLRHGLKALTNYEPRTLVCMQNPHLGIDDAHHPDMACPTPTDEQGRMGIYGMGDSYRQRVAAIHDLFRLVAQRRSVSGRQCAINAQHFTSHPGSQRGTVP